MTVTETRAEWPKPILITIGIIHLLGASCCLLNAATSIISLVMIAGMSDGGGGTFFGIMLIPILLYLALAAVGITAGVGLIRRREWARKMGRILQIPVFMMGLVAIGSFVWLLIMQDSSSEDVWGAVMGLAVSALFMIVPSSVFFVVLGRPAVIAETSGRPAEAGVESSYSPSLPDVQEPPPAPSDDR